MPGSLTTAAALLKELYEPGLVEQLNTEVVGLRRIEKTSEGTWADAGGRYVRFPVRVRRNQGIGYRQENEQLQAGGQQGYAAAQIGLKYGYGRLRLSGPVMDLAESNEEAFVNVMEEEVQGLKDDVLKDCNRIFYGDGTGALAVLTANATANTATAQSTQYLEVGQVVDIVSTAGASRGANRTITAINTTTGAVTYDGADITTDITGDYMVRQGDGPVSSTVFREPNGLKSIVAATGALYNIDPATEPVWAATVDANGGSNRPISETGLIAQVDAVRKWGGHTSVMFAGLGVRRSYFNLLVSQRRFTGTTKFDGGFSGLAFTTDQGDVPFVVDVDCPNNTVYGLDEKTIKLFRDKAWHFPALDGAMWKWVHDYDAWETLLKQYWEIGIKKRNANWVQKDLTES